MSVVPIKSQDHNSAEVAWFAPLCSDDYRYLGVPDGDLRSSWENTRAIAQMADRLGFRNILCPSSYQVGQDTLSFVAAMANKPGPRRKSTTKARSTILQTCPPIRLSLTNKEVHSFTLVGIHRWPWIYALPIATSI